MSDAIDPIFGSGRKASILILGPSIWTSSPWIPLLTMLQGYETNIN